MKRKKKNLYYKFAKFKKKIRWQLTSKIVTMLVRPTWRTVICRENKLYDMQTGIVLLTDSRVIFRFTSGFVDNRVTQLTSPLPFFPHPRSHVQSNKTQSTTKSTFTVLHMLHQSYWILDKECPAQHHTSAGLQSIAHVENNTNSVMCSFLFSFYPFMFFSSCPLLGAGVYLPHPPPAIGGGLGPEPWLILPILRRGYPGGPLPSSYPELDEELEPPLLVKSGRTIL